LFLLTICIDLNLKVLVVLFYKNFDKKNIFSNRLLPNLYGVISPFFASYRPHSGHQAVTVNKFMAGHQHTE